MRSILISFVVLTACGGGSAPSSSGQPAAAKVVGKDGPESIVVPAVTVSTTPDDIAKGKGLFASKGCQACHRTDDQKLVGPGLRGVTARRSPTWIERMMLHPEVMVREDPVAKELLAKHMVPMSNQNLNPTSDVPPLLAFLNSLE